MSLSSYRPLSEHPHSREEKRAWYTLFTHVLSSFGNVHTTGRTEHAFFSFSTHAQKPGNKAIDHSEHVNIAVKNAADLLLSIWPFQRVTLQHTHINTLT